MTMDSSTPRFAERLSAVIGLIYDTADNESLWPELLKGMADLLVVPNEITAQQLLSGEAALPTTTEWPMELSSAAGEAEQYLWACLAPHFARSQSMHAELRAAEVERDLLERVMDRLPLGMAIVNAQGRAISVNRAMVALTQSDAGLAMHAGHLVSAQPELLSHAIARVLERQQDHACLRLEQQLPLNAPGEHAATHTEIQGLALWVSRFGQAGAEGRAMVLAASPGSRALSEEGLMAFFNLSPAEARLTQQLALGRSIEEAAMALGIRHNTAKTQLKKVFAKVGVKRQPELLQAIYASPLWLDMGPQSRRMHPRRAALQAALASEDALPKGSGMRLPDGRWMAWSDSGDPQGWPVLLCHGFIGSCHERHPDDSQLIKMGIRLIIPERPGCGESDYQSNRKVADWPDDVACILDQLGINRFGVISWQLGAPYALELARAMPQRMQSISLVSPLAPVRGAKDLRFYAGDGAFLMGVAWYTPLLLLPTLHLVVGAILRNVYTVIENELRNEPAHAVINDPHFRAQRARTLLRAAKNGAKCTEAEALAPLKTWIADYPDWPFPITVWHGEADPQVSWRAGQKLAELVPGAALHVVPGSGNFLLFSHWKEILSALKDSALCAEAGTL